jgi:hypothetical protein
MSLAHEALFSEHDRAYRVAQSGLTRPPYGLATSSLEWTELVSLSAGPFSFPVSFPVPAEHGPWITFLFRFGFPLLIVLVSWWLKGRRHRNRILRNWEQVFVLAYRVENGRIQDANHDIAVGWCWSGWNRLSQLIRSQGEFPDRNVTWRQWNRISTHLRRHPWHLSRRLRRTVEQQN